MIEAWILPLSFLLDIDDECVLCGRYLCACFQAYVPLTECTPWSKLNCFKINRLELEEGRAKIKCISAVQVVSTSFINNKKKNTRLEKGLCLLDFIIEYTAKGTRWQVLVLEYCFVDYLGIFCQKKDYNCSQYVLQRQKVYLLVHIQLLRINDDVRSCGWQFWESWRFFSSIL